jgi:hypothetical protein
MSGDDAGAVAERYLAAWKANEWGGRDHLVRLHTSVPPPAPTANWSDVENGRITAIRVTFDARPLGSPGR